MSSPRNQSIKKRSVRIAGHDTSVTLEQPFWECLQEIAAQRSLSINALITEIDKTSESQNLSSAIRIHILQQYRNKTKT